VLGIFSLMQQQSFSGLAAREELKLQFDSVSSAFEYEGRAASLVATVVSHLPGIPEAMEHEDRDTIMRLVGPAMDSLKAQGVTYLNFFRPPATNMLRVHDPKAFGDDVSARRKTVVQVNHDHTAIAGVEADRIGLSVFGLCRSVVVIAMSDWSIPASLSGNHSSTGRRRGSASISRFIGSTASNSPPFPRPSPKRPRRPPTN